MTPLLSRELGDSDEPMGLGSAVKDCEGRLWLRGHRVWRLADTTHSNGRLNWLALVAEHGPLRTDSDTAAHEAGQRARRLHTLRPQAAKPSST